MLDKIQRYNKAIVALLTAGVVVFTPFIPKIEEVASVEWINSVAVIVGAVLVYAIPNKEETVTVTPDE